MGAKSGKDGVDGRAHKGCSLDRINDYHGQAGEEGGGSSAIRASNIPGPSRHSFTCTHILSYNPFEFCGGNSRSRSEYIKTSPAQKVNFK